MQSRQTAVEKALTGNHACPECGKTTEAYRVIPGRILQFTCPNNHTWLNPIIEKKTP